MTISFTRYVDITSVVGAANNIPNRTLNGRIFTTNPLVPAQSFITVTSPQDALAYFGSSTSEEYLRALFYFSFINKNGTAPGTLDFARWVDVDSPPTIYGNVQGQSVGAYSGITDGSFGLTIGADVNVFTGIDFSAAASLADVASILELTIQTAVGTQWTAATVTFDAVRGSFNFVGGDAVNAVISVQEGVVGTPIAGLVGWLSGAILSNGSLAESITETLTDSYAASNNFGSFLFMPTFDQDQIVEASAWANGLNVVVMYFPRVTAANAAAISAALASIGANGPTLAPLDTEYPEQFPMMILASIDYNATNSVQNYMYQQTTLTPSVTTDTDADLYDGLNVNYYGVTQIDGVLRAFYQRGTLNGLTTSPSTMTVFGNEMWFKSAVTAQIFNLLLALSQVPANTQGQAMLVATIQTVIDQAVNNGTISVGKTLNTVQKLYVTTVTGDPQAWQQVQSIGYWLNVEIVPLLVAINGNSVTQYQAVYTLVYSKDDTVNKVTGRDILI